ncbi:hypothetical protein [Sphingomonas sp.]|uniref:hypothetical protein n=1 Tax=Sphingomonas sp. TaxID=28214 RepID=UPI0025D00F72|nr:hypothetical protein [Sphingomonas sp.]MBV9528249.1 hypothetical protein [Sphingomonas sp.]
MSFLYPRVVAFNRPATQPGVGAQGYGGHTQATETLLFAGIPASIQERREGTNSTVGLPGDAQRPTWYVFIPKTALALGSIKDRDIMIDDVGLRYMVVAPYFDNFGYRLTVATLEA